MEVRYDNSRTNQSALCTNGYKHIRTCKAYWSVTSKLSAKLKRGTITDTELVKIADTLNISYEQSFILSNGEKIELTNGGAANE